MKTRHLPFLIFRLCGRVRPLPKSDESYDKAETESGDGFGGSRRGKSVKSPWKSYFQIQSHLGLGSIFEFDGWGTQFNP